MPLEPAVLGDLQPGEREDAIAGASRALGEGKLVVLPTETVYGVFARADLPGAIEALRGALAPGHDDGGPFVWHAPSAPSVRDLVDLPTPVARRLVSRLTPGPVNFTIEQSSERLAAIRESLGVGAGVIDDGSSVRVRVPDNLVAGEVLAGADAPVIAIALAAATFADTAPGADAGRTCAVSEASGSPVPGAILDDGPTRLGHPSTAIRLSLDGKFEISAGGAVDEQTVLSALERTVVFVCTGNTCRSPMAEGIARQVVTSGGFKGVTTRVESAGVAAAQGVPASAQAVEVMRAQGIDISAHRSRPLTPAMIRGAEVIFTMTPSHAEAAMTLAPEMAHKIFPLDPRGVIDDPVGHPVEVYARTAERLRELIEERLRELDA